MPDPVLHVVPKMWRNHMFPRKWSHPPWRKMQVRSVSQGGNVAGSAGRVRSKRHRALGRLDGEPLHHVHGALGIHDARGDHSEALEDGVREAAIAGRLVPRGAPEDLREEHERAKSDHPVIHERNGLGSDLVSKRDHRKVSS